MDRLWEFLFDWGTQYYLAGSFSAYAGFVAVSGSLLHHAIEMSLKGYLNRKAGITPLNLKQEFGHRLSDLWDTFKSHASDSTLNQFDHIIAELDKFENIRYPDDVAAKGMIALIQIKRPDSSITSALSKRPEPRYTLTVEEIDNLLKVIFETSSVNLDYFTMNLRKDALKYSDLFNKSDT